MYIHYITVLVFLVPFVHALQCDISFHDSPEKDWESFGQFPCSKEWCFDAAGTQWPQHNLDYHYRECDKVGWCPNIVGGNGCVSGAFNDLHNQLVFTGTVCCCNTTDGCNANLNAWDLYNQGGTVRKTQPKPYNVSDANSIVRVGAPEQAHNLDEETFIAQIVHNKPKALTVPSIGNELQLYTESVDKSGRISEDQYENVTSPVLNSPSTQSHNSNEFTKSREDHLPVAFNVTPTTTTPIFVTQVSTTQLHSHAMTSDTSTTMSTSMSSTTSSTTSTTTSTPSTTLVTTTPTTTSTSSPPTSQTSTTTTPTTSNKWSTTTFTTSPISTTTTSLPTTSITTRTTTTATPRRPFTHTDLHLLYTIVPQLPPFSPPSMTIERIELPITLPTPIFSNDLRSVDIHNTYKSQWAGSPSNRPLPPASYPIRPRPPGGRNIPAAPSRHQVIDLTQLILESPYKYSTAPSITRRPIVTKKGTPSPKWLQSVREWRLKQRSSNAHITVLSHTILVFIIMVNMVMLLL